MDLEKLISNPLAWLVGAGVIVGGLLFIIFLSLVISALQPEPVIFVTATLSPRVTPTVTPAATVIPEPTNSAAVIIPEVTPIVEPTVTPRPTQDITSMERFVVIITPTPVPVNKNITVQVTLPNNRIEINKYTNFDVYIRTFDQGYKNVTLRFNVSWADPKTYKNENDWVWLGYFPIQNYPLHLPANAQQTKPVSVFIPDRIPGSAMVIGPGVYCLTLDVISEDDSRIIGSDTVNNIQVVNYDPKSEGYVFH